MDKCIVCGGKMQGSRVKGLLKCENCGFMSADLNLSNAEIKQLYSENYYHGEEYADYLSDKQIIQKNFNKRLEKMKPYLDNVKDKKLFEIGCAYGFFLQVASQIFGKISGIDISEDAIKYAKEILKLDVYAGDFCLLDIQDKFDVICMWDTIEHLDKPELFVKKSYEILNKDGLLCITTGDIGSVNARLRGRKWRQIHPPTHLHYFSRKTLALLLEKEGFEILEVTYPANKISLNTVLYTILCLKSNCEKIYKFVEKIGITKWNININLHDFMYMIAKKND